MNKDKESSLSIMQHFVEEKFETRTPVFTIKAHTVTGVGFYYADLNRWVKLFDPTYGLIN